ncbi:MAG: hypothetical protein DRJ11_01385 [Candidatus Aminicenantes bacterium]|nr:MAG: hypothetical protein DRJ11_01385 [Candidatus Aminicenantes bacterium]
MKDRPLTQAEIFRLWFPMAATWLMMATEGPFLAAVIARLASPELNLAAYGVAYSFAVLVEAPIIMIMSASTALVKDNQSFVRLRNFTYGLNLGLTLILLLLLVPPLFNYITRGIIGLPLEVSRRTHQAVLALLPWPAAIGYRRFYQGILISRGLTRRVAYGTVTRVLSMMGVALIGARYFPLEGATIGGLALSAGVTAEAIASRFMAHSSVHRLRTQKSNDAHKKELKYRRIFHFYYPLALTSILALGVQPLVTFFLGHSRMALESLAVLPVINSLVFIFRSMGLSFQEVGIALLGDRDENLGALKKFAFRLGAFASGSLMLVAFTPLSLLWFEKVSGLVPELARFSLWPTRILVLLPALTVLLSFFRAYLVRHHVTKPITVATGIEVGVIVSVLLLTIHSLNFIGIIAAAMAMILGRFLADVYLIYPIMIVKRAFKFEAA